MGKTTKLLRALATAAEDAALTQKLQANASSQQTVVLGNEKNEKKEFIVQTSSQLWNKVCSQVGAQPPLIILRHGPNGEGLSEMHFANEAELLSVLLGHTGGDVTGTLEFRRRTLEKRGANADMTCKVEQGEPARYVQIHPSYEKMIQSEYAVAVTVQNMMRNQGQMAPQVQMNAQVPVRMAKETENTAQVQNQPQRAPQAQTQARKDDAAEYARIRRLEAELRAHQHVPNAAHNIANGVRW